MNNTENTDTEVVEDSENDPASPFSPLDRLKMLRDDVPSPPSGDRLPSRGDGMSPEIPDAFFKRQGPGQECGPDDPNEEHDVMFTDNDSSYSEVLIPLNHSAFNAFSSSATAARLSDVNSVSAQPEHGAQDNDKNPILVDPCTSAAGPMQGRTSASVEETVSKSNRSSELIQIHGRGSDENDSLTQDQSSPALGRPKAAEAQSTIESCVQSMHYGQGDGPWVNQSSAIEITTEQVQTTEKTKQSKPRRAQGRRRRRRRRYGYTRRENLSCADNSSMADTESQLSEVTTLSDETVDPNASPQMAAGREVPLGSHRCPNLEKIKPLVVGSTKGLMPENPQTSAVCAEVEHHEVDVARGKSDAINVGRTREESTTVDRGVTQHSVEELPETGTAGNARRFSGILSKYVSGKGVEESSEHNEGPKYSQKPDTSAVPAETEKDSLSWSDGSPSQSLIDPRRDKHTKKGDTVLPKVGLKGVDHLEGDASSGSSDQPAAINSNITDVTLAEREEKLRTHHGLESSLLEKLEKHHASAEHLIGLQNPAFVARVQGVLTSLAPLIEQLCRAHDQERKFVANERQKKMGPGQLALLKLQVQLMIERQHRLVAIHQHHEQLATAARGIGRSQQVPQGVSCSQELADPDTAEGKCARREGPSNERRDLSTKTKSNITASVTTVLQDTQTEPDPDTRGNRCTKSSIPVATDVKPSARSTITEGKRSAWLSVRRLNDGPSQDTVDPDMTVQPDNDGSSQETIDPTLDTGPPTDLIPGGKYSERIDDVNKSKQLTGRIPKANVMAQRTAMTGSKRKSSASLVDAVKKPKLAPSVTLCGVRSERSKVPSLLLKENQEVEHWENQSCRETICSSAHPCRIVSFKPSVNGNRDTEATEVTLMGSDDVDSDPGSMAVEGRGSPSPDMFTERNDTDLHNTEVDLGYYPDGQYVGTEGSLLERSQSPDTAAPETSIAAKSGDNMDERRLAGRKSSAVGTNLSFVHGTDRNEDALRAEVNRAQDVTFIQELSSPLVTRGCDQNTADGQSLGSPLSSIYGGELRPIRPAPRLAPGSSLTPSPQHLKVVTSANSLGSLLKQPVLKQQTKPSTFTKLSTTQVKPPNVPCPLRPVRLVSVQSTGAKPSSTVGQNQITVVRAVPITKSTNEKGSSSVSYIQRVSAAPTSQSTAPSNKVQDRLASAKPGQVISRVVAVSRAGSQTNTSAATSSSQRFIQPTERSTQIDTSIKKKQVTIRTGRLPDLVDLVKSGILKPGSNVCTLESESRTFKASLTEMGWLRGEGGEIFRTPMAWYKAVIPGVQKQVITKKIAHAKVCYKGIPLTNITAQETPGVNDTNPECSQLLTTLSLPNKSLNCPAPDVQNPSLTSSGESGHDQQGEPLWRLMLQRCRVVAVHSKREFVPNDALLPVNFWTEADFGKVELPPALVQDLDLW